MNAIEKLPLKDGNTLEIFPDEDPVNPRTDYDNFGHMVCFHRHYSLGDKTDLNSRDFSSWTDLKNHLVKKKHARVILPIYMLDHSGLWIRTYSFSDVDPGLWDSGPIGFIYVSAEDIKKEFSVKRITGKTLLKAEKILLQEIETYNDYLTGNVYGYQIKDPAGEIIDSCFGFIGDYTGIVSEFRSQLKEVPG